MDENKVNAVVELGSEVEEEEEISESFICCVCLDLLYKPIVLACGHVSCFWCVQKSMNGLRESNCAICRHPYHHFPTICEMLHFLFIKMYPNAYRRRENQIIDEEKKTACFSPQIERKFSECSRLGESAHSSKSESTSASSTFNGPRTSDLFLSEFGYKLQDAVAIEESNFSQKNTDGSLNHISIADVLCPSCKQLILHPSVLNCGHAYCETCITPEDEIIVCRICKSPHPSDCLKVCLVLSNFLEETFPKEYALRRESTEHRQVEFQVKSPPAGSSSTKSAKRGYLSSFPTGELLPWWREHGLIVHSEVGCDTCGMYPIVGDRYRCKDCHEAMGFDLCGECYRTRSKLPGRFNQRHTADHKFDLLKTANIWRNMLRLVTRRLDNGSFILSDYATEDSEDGSAPVGSSNNAREVTDSNREPYRT